MLLRALAAVSLLLLVYELRTLLVAMLMPLADNPSVLQTDFHYYYDAARRFAADRTQLYLATDDVIAGFAYPPLAILPFLLLSRMPLGAAVMLLTVISYAAVIAALWLWRGYLREHGLKIDRGASIAVLLVAVALGPTYSNAIFGQVNALILLSCVAFLTLHRRRPLAAGVLLALGAWLKVYPVLMAWAGAWHRKAWRSIAAAAVAGVLLLVVALPVIPFQAHLAFVGEVLPARIDKTAIHISNQSFVAFVERFRHPPSRFLYWTGEQAVTVRAAVRADALAFGAVALLWLWRRARLDPLGSDAALMALVAVMAPLGWGHTYVMALPLVTLRLLQARQQGIWRQVITFLCVIALMVPAGRVVAVANEWPGWLQNFLYSRYLIAAIVLAVFFRASQPRFAPSGNENVIAKA